MTLRLILHLSPTTQAAPTTHADPTVARCPSCAVASTTLSCCEKCGQQRPRRVRARQGYTASVKNRWEKRRIESRAESGRAVGESGELDTG
eukprot:1185960-Prorocentrum_minimum.AAC.4